MTHEKLSRVIPLMDCGSTLVGGDWRSGWAAFVDLPRSFLLSVMSGWPPPGAQAGWKQVGT